MKYAAVFEIAFKNNDNNNCLRQNNIVSTLTKYCFDNSIENKRLLQTRRKYVHSFELKKQREREQEG